MNKTIIVSVVFALVQGILCLETNPCFDYLRDRFGNQVLTNGPNAHNGHRKASFYLTNYQGILRCAKTISEDTIYGDNFGPFGQPINKCLWLDNLDYCIRRWKEKGVDCEQPFKNLIQSFIQVNSTCFITKLSPIISILFCTFQEKSEYNPKCFHDYVNGSYKPKSDL